MYLSSLHYHHQNDFCINMGIHFKILLIVRDKVTRQMSTDHNFEDKGEPKRNRTEVLLLTSLKGSTITQRRVQFIFDDDDEVMLNVLRCQLTY